MIRQGQPARTPVKRSLLFGGFNILKACIAEMGLFRVGVGGRLFRTGRNSPEIINGALLLGLLVCVPVYASELCENATAWTLSGYSSDYCRLADSVDPSTGGQRVLKLNYDFKVLKESGNRLRIGLKAPLKLSPDAKEISVRIYDESPPCWQKFYFECMDAGKEIVLYDNTGPKTQRRLVHEGWFTYKIDLENSLKVIFMGQERNEKFDYPLYFTGFWLDPANRNHLRGTLFFDDLTVVYKDGRQEKPGTDILLSPVSARQKIITEPVSLRSVESKPFGNIAWDGEPQSIALTLEVPKALQQQAQKVVEYRDKEGNLLLQNEQTVDFKSGPTTINVPGEITGYYQLNCTFSREGKALFRYHTQGGAFTSSTFTEGADTVLGAGCWGGPDWQIICSTLKKMGVFWLRTNASWNVIESKPGQFNWEAFDSLCNAAKHNNINLLITIPYTPRWAAVPPYHQHGGNPEPEAWKAYLRTLLARHGQQIKYYEVWNEPDTPYHWAGGAKAYYQHLQDSFKVIKLLDANAKVLHGGLTSSEHLWRPFMEELLDRGGGKYFDIYSFHYGDGKFAQKHRDLLKKHNHKQPLWNTEHGFGNYNDVIWEAVCDIANGVEKVFYFELYGRGHFGDVYMLDKPTYIPSAIMPMWMTLSQKINHSVCKETFDWSGVCQAFEFCSQDGGSTMVFRSRDKQSTGISLKTVNKQITFTDFLGRKHVLSPVNGWISLPSHNPGYLDISSDKITKTGPSMIVLPEKIEMMAGTLNVVQIKLFNPGDAPVAGNLVLKGSTDWPHASDSGSVTIPPGQAIEVQRKLEPGLELVGAGFRLDAILEIDGRQAALQQAVGSIRTSVSVTLTPVIQDGKPQLTVTGRNLGDKTVNSTIELTFPTSWNQSDCRTLTLNPNECRSYILDVSHSVTEKENEQSYIIDIEQKILGKTIRSEATLSWIYIPFFPEFDWKCIPLEILLKERKDFIPDSQLLETWTGPNDLSVKFKWAWNRDAIGLNWEVRDNVHCNSMTLENLWSNDSIQLWFDGVLYDLALVNDKSVFYERRQKDVASPYHLNLKVDRQEQEKITIYSLTISPVDGKSFAAGGSFQMGFCVNDNDGEKIRKGWMYYLSKIGYAEVRTRSPEVFLTK